MPAKCFKNDYRGSLCPRIVKFCRSLKFMPAKVNHVKDNADESLCP